MCMGLTLGVAEWTSICVYLSFFVCVSVCVSVCVFVYACVFMCINACMSMCIRASHVPHSTHSRALTSHESRDKARTRAHK